MNALLEWAGILALCMLGVAVLVAGWEHLAREAAAADRGTDPGAWPPAHPGLRSGAVDVPIDPGIDAPADSNASHAAMAAVLTRAAARPPRDGSPWLDTCPQVTLGCVDGEDTRAAEPAIAPAPVPAPAPDDGARPSTIERAALR